MSKLTLTMKSLLAIGAAAALTISASADEPKTKAPKADEAKALVAGSGAGKANFQDLSVTKYAKGGDDEDELDTLGEHVGPKAAQAAPRGDTAEIENDIAAPVWRCSPWPECKSYGPGGDVESEGDIIHNLISAPNDKLGPIKGESQDRAVQSGCEPYPACARNKEAMEDEIAAPIKSEGFKPVAGAALAKDSDGEDRLTENVSIASGPKGMMPEAKKDAAEKIGGDDPIDGIDIIVKKRPEDR